VVATVAFQRHAVADLGGELLRPGAGRDHQLVDR
jgi:hypothetical protein